MEKEFVPFELAIKLKDLGFDEPCFGFYVNNKVKYGIASVDKNINKCWVDELFCTASTFSQAFRFFRDKYNLDVNTQKDSIGVYHFNIDTNKYGDWVEPIFNRKYEEAEIECLKKLIEIVKEQNVK